MRRSKVSCGFHHQTASWHGAIIATWSFLNKSLHFGLHAWLIQCYIFQLQVVMVIVSSIGVCTGCLHIHYDPVVVVQLLKQVVSTTLTVHWYKMNYIHYDKLLTRTQVITIWWMQWWTVFQGNFTLWINHTGVLCGWRSSNICDKWTIQATLMLKTFD